MKPETEHLRQAAAMMGRLGGRAGKGAVKRNKMSGAPAANARWARRRAERKHAETNTQEGL